MDLILNGETLALDTAECANLAELVLMADAATAKPEETVVVSVEVDGEKLSSEALSDLQTRSVAGVTRVEIQRVPTSVVARSVLEQGADYCGQIDLALDETVEEFRAGRSDRGSEILADVSDSLNVLTGITYSVASSLPASAEALATVQSEIFPWLQELVEAQSEQDPLRIADLLEYEIKPRVSDWSVVMRSMAKEAGASPISN